MATHHKRGPLAQGPTEALKRKLKVSRTQLISVSRTHTISRHVAIDKIDPTKLKLVASIEFPPSHRAKIALFLRDLNKNSIPSRPFTYRPFPVSRETRELAAESFPRLNENPAYWRLFSYLFAGDYLDYASGRPITSREILAKTAGKSSSSNFKAGDFLWDFQKNIIGAAHFGYLSTWVPNRKARRATYLILPDALQKALDDEDFLCGKGKVCLCDGTVFNAAKQRAIREEVRQKALSASRAAKSKAAVFVLDYLNNLPHHLFGKITRNAAAARKVVASIKGERSRTQSLAYLRGTLAEPQTFYQPSSGEGDRIFGVGGCLTMLGSKVRAVLAPDWHEADLANAQLAICAKLWGIQEVEEFLARGVSIWQELIRHMEIPTHLHKEGKAVLKESLYATCYGMSRDNLEVNVAELLDDIGVARSGELFLSHPIIKAIIKARGRMLKKIRMECGMETCFGRFIPINKGWHKRKEEYGPRKRGRKLYAAKAVKPHQILAMVSQAQELQLLLPAFELAAKHRRDFTITLFQHDGFSVKIMRRAKYWKDRINEGVEEKIREGGFLTALEWK